MRNPLDCLLVRFCYICLLMSALKLENSEDCCLSPNYSYLPLKMLSSLITKTTMYKPDLMGYFPTAEQYCLGQTLMMISNDTIGCSLYNLKYIC